MPPLFGQGLCSGIRDAANLAWKLALVLDGAPSRLLDTYESERSAHVRSWIEHATAMKRFMQTTDPVVAEQRDAHIRAHPEQSMPVAPALGPGLHAGSPPAGRLAPQPLLADGRRFDDLIGRDFSVVGHPTLLAELPAELRDTLATHPRVTLVDPDTPGTAEFLAALAALMPDATPAAGPLAAVVRPDRYLLGAATNAHELAAQCRMALGACGGDLREPLSV
jgi:3-(3-hydroxy-phenyl)propionate hydroxylase